MSQDFQDIQTGIHEWEQQFQPSEPRVLKWYSRKRKCIQTSMSTDDLYYSDHSHPYFRTEDEYALAIWNRLRYDQVMGNSHPYSYIEVYTNEGEFLRRHYVRFGKLTPYISTDPGAGNDPLLRGQQIAARPYLNWKRITGDSIMGVEKREVELREFASKYKML